MLVFGNVDVEVTAAPLAPHVPTSVTVTVKAQVSPGPPAGVGVVEVPGGTTTGVLVGDVVTGGGVGAVVVGVCGVGEGVLVETGGGFGVVATGVVVFGVVATGVVVFEVLVVGTLVGGFVVAAVVFSAGAEAIWA
jgi:hypothetical protein